MDRPSWLRGPALADSPVPTPRGVLFVCTGNICRSAFAEAYLRQQLASRGITDVPVASAGTAAVVGHDMDADMAAQAHSIGLSATGHVARQLTGRLLRGAALILVFGPEHLEWITDEHPEFLARTLALGQAARALADSPTVSGPSAVPPTVRASRPRPHDRDWIPDPYRRGPEAARRTARRIRADVDTLDDHVDWSS